MEHKQKQWIKGLMLSTVLGLGVSVAVDISHAAGNGLSQTQIVNEWDAQTTYTKGNLVMYKGILFTMDKTSSKGHNPEQSYHWKPMNGFIPEWHEYKPYDKGDFVTYKGIQYRAQIYTIGEQPDCTSSKWEVVKKDLSKEIPKKEDGKDAVVNANAEWDCDRVYFGGEIVSYKNIQYKMIDSIFSMGHQPDTTPSKWEVVKEGLSKEIPKKEDGKDTSVIKEWKKQEMYYTIGTIVTYKGVQYEKVSHSYNDSEPGTNDQSWKKVEQLKADEGIVYKEPMYENSESYFRLKNGTANSLASHGMVSTNPYHARYIKFVENGWNTIRGKKCYVENNQWVVDTVKVIDGIEYFFAENGVATEVK